jgi:putative flavoprotein involved in K+ transport
MLDCLIIGAGHSGLICAGLLARQGVHYAVVDAGARIGDVWRRRPKSLRLFTSRQFCRVLGEPLPGNDDGYASAEEFADYLEAVARRRGIVPSMSTRVVRLERAQEKGFLVRFADGGSLLTKSVIDATGANQVACRPSFADGLASSVRQIASGEYRSSEDFVRGQSIAVVGDGASGRQIAAELVADGHSVTLLRGRTRKLLPQRMLGRDIFWWLIAFRLIFASRDSWLGRLVRARDPVPVAHLNDAALLARGVRLAQRAIGARGDELHLDDGSGMRCAAVIWCIGYESRIDWIDLPGIGSAEDLLQGEGVTGESGFYVVGRKWLSCRASELVAGVDHDARRVTDHLCSWLGRSSQARALSLKACREQLR